MLTEVCSHCHNTVGGQFSPSTTRRWLTAIAKKGGMKAVLTAVGSAVPVIGNIAGYLTGTAIDLIYGKDIEKLIDKIADEFDDNKIYVFECPQCGHSWTRKEDEIGLHESADYEEDEEVDECGDEDEYEYREEDEAELFQANYNDYLEKIDEATNNQKLTETLRERMESFAATSEYESVYRGKYLFLAGICDLLYVLENYFEKDTRRNLKFARKNFREASKYLSNTENECALMSAAVATLWFDKPQDVLKNDTIDTYYYKLDSDIFKDDFLKSIYEKSRFYSIWKAYQDLLDSKADNNIEIELLQKGLKLYDADYLLVCNSRLYRYYQLDKTSTGKMSLRCARSVNDAYHTQRYSIDNLGEPNLFNTSWLEMYIAYACSLIEDTDPYGSKDVQTGMRMLENVANLDISGFEKLRGLAIFDLAEYYENGECIERNLSKALEYYERASEFFDCNEDIARVRVLLECLSNVSSESVLSAEEEEYLTEYKACIEEDGVISDRERRLLDRICKSLGISEERAKELEASCAQIELTAEEQEYADEIKACLEGDGIITDRERRLLNRLRLSLEISEDRAREIEDSLK